jgi:hypothetical protein
MLNKSLLVVNEKGPILSYFVWPIIRLDYTTDLAIGKMLYHIVCIGFLLSFALLGKSSGQAVFSEGILTYRIDTLRRLD